jgi:hypothetical protein
MTAARADLFPGHDRAGQYSLRAADAAKGTAGTGSAKFCGSHTVDNAVEPIVRNINLNCKVSAAVRRH